MNVLSNPMAGGQIELFENIKDRYGITNLYVIQFEDHQKDLDKSSLTSILKEKFLYLDVIGCSYERYVFYNDMKPLDKEILDKMALYEPNALKMLERDGRIYDSAEDRFIKYHRHLRYWNNFLEKAKIDLFIAELTPHAIYDYIIMRLCQIKGIPVLCTEIMPFGNNRLMAYLDFENDDQRIVDEVSLNREKLEKGEEVKIPKDIMHSYDKFMGVKKHIIPTKINKSGMMKARMKLLKKIWEKNPRRAMKKVRDYVKSWIETGRLNSLYNKLSYIPDMNAPYIYFPLHHQPEYTTNPMGGWFVHQYLAIEMLSYYLPEGAWIYVKEHPMIQQKIEHARIPEHYYIMKRLRNVKLVDLSVDAMPLIENSIAVASVTGSVGYEAMYRHKPFLMFGNKVMRYSPATFNIRNNKDCKTAVENIFGQKYNVTDKDIKAFLAAIGKFSYPVKLIKGGFGWDRDEKNVKRVTEMFTNELDPYFLSSTDEKTAMD